MLTITVDTLVDQLDGSRIFTIDDGDNGAGSPVTIRGLTLTGGDVRRDGGAIRSEEPLTVTSSTISGNSADFGSGSGGIFAGGDVTVTIDHSIVAGNTARDTAPDVRPGTGPLAVRYSLIGDNTDTGLAEAPVGAPDANGNLIGSARLAEHPHRPQQITRAHRSRLAERAVPDRVVDRVLGEETK